MFLFFFRERTGVSGKITDGEKRDDTSVWGVF